MPKEENTGCAYGKVTRTMLKGLEDKFDGIKEIRDKINNPRPSWAMTVVITVLSSTCVGLIVTFFKMMGG